MSKDGAPHDPLANKSVVLRATDGLLAFAYTGPAFLGGLPTDTWIADVVSGGACASANGAVAYGSFPVRDTGSSLVSVSRGLRASTLFRRFGGEVAATGWQWNARRRKTFARPVLWRLRNGSGRLRWTQLMPRHLPERHTQFRIVPVGDWPLSASVWSELVQSVGRAGADWERVEELLIEGIRRSSAERPGTIGSDCISILIRPSGFPNARARFHPARAHVGCSFGQEVHVAYTPWMVAPDAVYAPLVLVGGLTCEQGLLNFTFEAEQVPDTQRIKGAFRTQVRPHA